jgi:hypothetical protein
MTVLLPRLPGAVAESHLRVADKEFRSATHARGQFFAPIGGRRLTESELSTFRGKVLNLATKYGFPAEASSDGRVAFDREAADLMRTELDLTWAEAGSRDGWTWLACVLLPDVTNWRFGMKNIQRWIASDLTRHTWSRLWWQAVVFGVGSELIRGLSESDLNQILERRTIGGDPRLVRYLAETVLESTSTGDLQRRAFIRDMTARLRRKLAFLDVRSLEDDDMRGLCRETALETALVLRARTE